MKNISYSWRKDSEKIYLCQKIKDNMAQIYIKENIAREINMNSPIRLELMICQKREKICWQVDVHSELLIIYL